GGGGAVPTAKA
nr:Chain D, substrate peptide (pep2) [Staphylococcus aureus]